MPYVFPTFKKMFLFSNPKRWQESTKVRLNSAKVRIYNAVSFVFIFVHRHMCTFSQPCYQNFKGNNKKWEKFSRDNTQRLHKYPYHPLLNISFKHTWFLSMLWKKRSIFLCHTLLCHTPDFQRN